jgi:exodeoxyribonuclease VII small subunit
MPKEKKEIKYSQALSELQQIVEQLQDETIDVDELSSKVKRATELIHICKQKIQNTEMEVETILDKFQKTQKDESKKD